MREWKMRLPPRKPLPPDATDEMKAADAFERAGDEDRASESALLAEAIGEISKIVLSFDDEGRYRLAQVLAVLGPEPEETEPNVWAEAVNNGAKAVLAYLAELQAQRQTRAPCADCVKKRVVAPASEPVPELHVASWMLDPNGGIKITFEELRELRDMLGARNVQTVLDILASRRANAGTPKEVDPDPSDDPPS